MLLRLLLLFTLVPLVELSILIWIASRTDPWFTVGLVLVTGVLGATLARWQGTRCWLRVHEELAAGRVPGSPLLDALMILVAGALLVTPGVLTDLLGFSLLTPWFRNVMRRWLKRRYQARLDVLSSMHGVPPGAAAPGDEIIDVRVLDPPGEEGE